MPECGWGNIEITLGRRAGYVIAALTPAASADATAAALRLSAGTSHIASSAMRVDILLLPAVRSANTIGTSRTLKPASRAR